MQNFAIAATLVALVPYVAASGINTPMNVKECEPSQLQLDGIAPFWISIIPGGQASGTAYRNFPSQTSNTMTWKCDIPAGTSITFSVKDSTGAVGYSDKVNVASGTDKSCVNNNSPSAAPDNAGTAPVPDASPNKPPATAPQPAAPSASASAVSHVSASAVTQTPASRPVVQAVTTSGTVSAATASRSATSGADSQISLVKSSFVGMLAAVGAILF